MNNGNEIDFLRTYKDLVFQFHKLDRHIGYCLRYCLNKKGTASPEKWLVKSFESKVKMIIALASLVELQDSFDTWHEQVKKIQHFRSLVTHAHWEWKGPMPRPIHYHAPEIKNGEGVLSTHEFQKRLDQLKYISERFFELSYTLRMAIDKTSNEP